MDKFRSKPKTIRPQSTVRLHTRISSRRPLHQKATTAMVTIIWSVTVLQTQLPTFPLGAFNLETMIPHPLTIYSLKTIKVQFRTLQLRALLPCCSCMSTMLSRQETVQIQLRTFPPRALLRDTKLSRQETVQMWILPQPRPLTLGAHRQETWQPESQYKHWKKTTTWVNSP